MKFVSLHKIYNYMHINKYIAFAFLLVVIAFMGCNRDNTVKRYEHLGNTPYQEDTVLVTYATNPERALLLLDSALILGNIDDFHGQLYRATIFSKSLEEQCQDSAVHICESLLKHDSVIGKPENRWAVLDVLINTSRIKGDDNEYLRWATQKVEVCRKLGEEVELLRLEAEIGMLMTHLGQIEEGLAKIDKSINKLNKPGSVDCMDAYVIASKRKITVINDIGKYEEIIPLAQGILDRLSHYEQHVKDYADDSYRLLWRDIPSDRARYLDFTRAQANGFMAIAYAKLGNAAKAREYMAAFGKSDYGKSFSARRMIVPAQMALGMYDEAMTTCDQMVSNMASDTVNTIFAQILYDRAVVARAKGNMSEAYYFMNRHASLNKVLNDSLHRSEAHNYAALYHAKEQQLAIHQAESRNKQISIIAIAISVLLVVAIIAIFYFGRQRHRIVKKNRALVRMINESKQLPIENDITDEIVADNIDEDIDDEEGALVNMEKFSTIDATIRNERIYCNPNLQRQDICDRFNINRIMLNNMLQQHRGNASLPNYINSIRLEEAVRMLRESPEASITVIAKSVGFSPANLRKHFIRNFGMTPLEYRQSL